MSFTEETAAAVDAPVVCRQLRVAFGAPEACLVEGVALCRCFLRSVHLRVKVRIRVRIRVRVRVGVRVRVRVSSLPCRRSC